MKSKFKTTNFSDTGVLVAIGTDGKKFYKAIDIARSLGYKRPDAAVKRFCKNPVTIVAPTFNQFGGQAEQPVKFIDVDDVIRILYGCTLPKAVNFRMNMEAEIIAEKAAKEAAKRAAAEKAAKEAAAKKAAKNKDVPQAIQRLEELISILSDESNVEMPTIIMVSL